MAAFPHGHGDAAVALRGARLPMSLALVAMAWSPARAAAPTGSFAGQPAVCPAGADEAVRSGSATCVGETSLADDASLLQHSHYFSPQEGLWCAGRLGASLCASLAAAAAGLAFAMTAGPHDPCPADADWIVVGGGAGGSAAAAALADHGQNVLVLERGPSDLDVPSTQAQSGWPKSVNDAGQYIRFAEGTWGVVGRVLGGGTSLNGGLYLQDSPEWFAEHMPGVDFDRINASYHEVLAQLGSASQPTAFGEAWNRALQERGYGTADTAHAQLGFSMGRPYLPYSTFNQTAPGAPRLGAAHLLHLRSSVQNLRVATYAEVERVLFDGNRAVGVRAKVGKWPRRHKCDNVRARKGVLVSAGAVFTPQLLQLSGVGPRAHLEKLGVEVIADLPVGQNFTDRLVAPLAVLSPVEIPLTVGYTVVVDTKDGVVIEGVGGGRVAEELGIASVAMVPPKMRSAALRPLLKDVFRLLPKRLGQFFNNMIQPVALQTDTHSRGSIMAESLRASTPPRVSANYFADPRDWRSQQQRFERLIQLVETPALANFTRTKREVNRRLQQYLQRPDARALRRALHCLFQTGNEEVTMVTVPCVPETPRGRDKFLRDNIVSSYHYFGTAAVGAVVDHGDFSVKGTQGLHVVDASVIPAPTTINPQGTIMALGHYLGSLLGAQQRLGRASETAILFP